MFKSVQNYPVALLAVAAVAFGAWLWYDATPSTAAPTDELDPGETIEVCAEWLPPFDLPESQEDPRPLLAKMPPGVPRAVLEFKLGLHPLPHSVSPVSAKDGIATYTVSYPVPGPPLVLSFDATQPGHPFVGEADAGPRS